MYDFFKMNLEEQRKQLRLDGLWLDKNQLGNLNNDASYIIDVTVTLQLRLKANAKFQSQMLHTLQ